VTLTGVTNQTTLILAPLVGAYLVLSATGFLRAPGAAADFFEDLSKHPAAVHAVGAIAFLTGAAILSFHRHWATPAEIAVSATGLWWAFEGGGMLAAPEQVRRAMMRRGASRAMRVLNGIALPIGVYLIIVAIIGRIG